VRMSVAVDPLGEGFFGGRFDFIRLFIGGRAEVRGDAVVFGLRQRCRAMRR